MGGRPPHRGLAPGLPPVLANVTGVYVPMFYEPVYDGKDLVAINPTEPGIRSWSRSASIADLAEWPYPRTSWSR